LAKCAPLKLTIVSPPLLVLGPLSGRSYPKCIPNENLRQNLGASLEVLDMLEEGDALRSTLNANSAFFRTQMVAAGFTLRGADHAIIPVMIGDAALASQMADSLLREGIYVIGFSYPVVPKGQSRIRTQMSAAHTQEQLDRAVQAFMKVGTQLNILTKDPA